MRLFTLEYQCLRPLGGVKACQLQLLVGDFNENFWSADGESIHLASVAGCISLSAVSRLKHLLNLRAHELPDHSIILNHVAKYNHESAPQAFVSNTGKLLDHKENTLYVAFFCQTGCNLSCASKHNQNAGDRQGQRFIFANTWKDIHDRLEKKIFLFSVHDWLRQVINGDLLL